MFYQGAYTSIHLRGLKHMCEVSYWQWKYCGRAEADGRLAAILNRRFTHIIRHIMPHAGWTADIEYDRILEIEKETLGTSEFSNGIASKHPVDKNGKLKS